MLNSKYGKNNNLILKNSLKTRVSTTVAPTGRRSPMTPMILTGESIMNGLKTEGISLRKSSKLKKMKMSKGSWTFNF